MGVIDDIKTNLRKAYTKLETKGATIPAHKNMENLEDTIDSVTTSKEEQTKTVGLSMENGDQIVTPDTNKVLSQVTITKPATLIAGNIKKDVNIGGVIGSFEGGANIFNISTTLTNCTALINNPTIIAQNGTATLGFTASSGNHLPSSITVTGASYTWDDSTGILSLSNPTGDISITITGIAPDNILENNSWETIKSACEAGNPILSTWLGQTKSSTYNGVATSFRLVDTTVGRYKFTDDYTDSHAVFEMVNVTSNTFPYDSGSASYKDYNSSSMKTTYNTTNYNYLASDLKSLLKNTTVYSIRGTDNPSSNYPALNCKLFPASIVEMCGDTNYSRFTGETTGGQFEYYAGKGNIYQVKTPVGSATNVEYRLRTPYNSGNTMYISVNGGGNQWGNYTDNRNGSVCFAF